MTTLPNPQTPLSPAGHDRRQAMREELVSVFVRHHTRRRRTRRIGALLIVSLAVGTGARYGAQALVHRPPESGVAANSANETHNKLINYVEIVRTSQQSLVKRIESDPGKVQMIDNDQLWEDLRRSGYNGGLIEIDGHIALTRRIAADTSAQSRDAL